MKIYVGAGGDAESWSKLGWTCNDLEPAAKMYAPHITIVGPCWSLPSVADASVDEIMAKGMLEHLTYHEVLASFSEWKRVLKPGGYFTVEVPDVEEYLRQYFAIKADPKLDAEMEACLFPAPGEPGDFYGVCSGVERWLRRALWGWQRYPGDEHRSGWTEKILKHYLNQFSPKNEIRRMAYGFDEDAPDAKMRHLWARAWKE